MEQVIKKISATSTYPIRQAVLRTGKPIESCLFDGDDLPSTQHFGCFLNNQLVGVVSVYAVCNMLFGEKKSFQIRGMAVLDSHQKKGIGEALMRDAEIYCQSQQAALIWFNARTSAVGFYKKMGYEILGSEFEIKEVGPHYVMHKQI